MKFQFDAHQQYQEAAISAVVDLFRGQPQEAETLRYSLSASPEYCAMLEAEEAGKGVLLTDYDPRQEIGAIGNNLVLDQQTIFENLCSVQDRNGIPLSDSEGFSFLVSGVVRVCGLFSSVPHTRLG